MWYCLHLTTEVYLLPLSATHGFINKWPNCPLINWEAIVDICHRVASPVFANKRCRVHLAARNKSCTNQKAKYQPHSPTGGIDCTYQDKKHLTSSFKMSLFPKKSVSKKAKYSPSREKFSEAKQLPEIKIEEIDKLQLPVSDVPRRSNWRKLKAIPLLLQFKPLNTWTLHITSYNEWEDERRQVKKPADAPQTLTLPVVPTVTRPKPFETRKGKSILRVGGLFIRHDRDGCLHLWFVSHILHFFCVTVSVTLAHSVKY